MTTRMKLMRTASALTLVFGLSACIASKAPLEGAGEAMTQAEVQAFVAPGALAELSLRPAPEGSALAREGFFLYDEDRNVPARFFPHPRGVVIETLVAKGARVYCAGLPDPGGIAVYCDEFHLFAAATDRKHDEIEIGRKALSVARRHATLRQEPGNGAGVFVPHDVDGVIAIYEALRDAGLKPQAVIPVNKGKRT